MTGNGPTENSSGYMLDTTEFNAVAKDYVDISAYADLRLVATHVQRDELKCTADPQKLANLLETFEELAPEMMPTESAVFDVSAFDEAKWTGNDSKFDAMLTRLVELDGRERSPNQHRDILIAETAIKNGLTLISDDRRLRKVTEEFGGKTIKPPRSGHVEDGSR